MSKVQNECQFGSGAQTMAVLDEYFGFELVKLARNAQAEIINLKCKNMGDVSHFIERYKTLNHRMEAAEEPMALGMQLMILRGQLSKIRELSAVIAQFESLPQIKQDPALLVKNIEEHIQQNRDSYNLMNAGAGVAAAAKGGDGGGRGGGRGKGKDGKGRGKGAKGKGNGNKGPGVNPQNFANFQNFVPPPQGFGVGRGRGRGKGFDGAKGKGKNAGKNKGKPGPQIAQPQDGTHGCQICRRGNHATAQCWWNPANQGVQGAWAATSDQDWSQGNWNQNQNMNQQSNPQGGGQIMQQQQQHHNQGQSSAASSSGNAIEDGIATLAMSDSFRSAITQALLRRAGMGTCAVEIPETQSEQTECATENVETETKCLVAAPSIEEVFSDDDYTFKTGQKPSTDFPDITKACSVWIADTGASTM